MSSPDRLGAREAEGAALAAAAPAGPPAPGTPPATRGDRPAGRSGPADGFPSPGEALDVLAGCADPFLIGVRHHSPALAAAVPALLDAAAPEVLFVELPEEFAPWLEHLADPATVPPVALAGSGAELVFLPFAEFSPELAALRWARKAGVEVIPFDLPLAARHPRRPAGHGLPEPGAAAPDSAGRGPGPVPDRVGGTADAAERHGDLPPGAVARALGARAGGNPRADLWERLVESAAPGGEPEALRRAALLVGWALRADAGEVDPYDLRREANMRLRLAERRGRRAAALIGAFHAPALVGGAGDGVPEPPVSPEGSGADAGAAEVVTSLVPYAYELLDERSGYPAGIRDPEWQHGVHEAAGDPARLDELLTSMAVRICAAVRESGHPSGPADAREVVRVARDLAALRGLPAAGRGELAEAAGTVLTQGSLLGRGRVVAAAMERVLVGRRQGVLAPGTPRSGLGPAVEEELAALRLPGPGETETRELRLDVLRAGLDRKREICLRRLSVCGVLYGRESEVAGTGDAAALTTRWMVAWSPSTAAMLDVTGVHGVTLEQAAAGLLRQRWAAERQRGGPTAAQSLAGLEAAARCALPGPAAERLAEVTVLLPAGGTLPELLDGLALLDRIGSGQIPGIGAEWRSAEVAAAYEELTAAGVRSLDGLAGSDDPADARALVALAGRAAPVGGGLRLADALERLESAATPLMRGAAGAARVLLGQSDPAAFGVRLAARADGAGTPELRRQLSDHLRGVLTAAGPLMEAGPALDPLMERVESQPDRAFLERLPALRAGFDTLSPAARSRLLAVVEDRTGTAAGVLRGHVADPAVLALLALADLAGREALTASGLGAGGPAARDGTGPGARGLGTDDRGPVRPGLAGPQRAPGSGARTADGPAEKGRVPEAGAEGSGAGKGGPLPEVERASAGPGGPVRGTSAPDRTVAANGAEADGSGTAAVPGAPAPGAAPDPAAGPDGGGNRPPVPEPGGAAGSPLTAGERWRLLLGRGRDLTGRAQRYATALDELYGRGRGEGALAGEEESGNGSRGGADAPYPGVREWSEELAALFGPGVREEVLAAAADTGRLDAALELDPESARPSVELLRTVLSYAGGLPEQQLARLRPLVARLVRELTEALSRTLRPAVTGISHPRPTRRPGGPLDLSRTVRANLATVRRDSGTGAVTVLPERPVFRTRARKSADWRLVLVVDVSGSMEASTIWSALTASVLAGVPAISTHFVAFSTEVVDLTDRVDDPLSLLLEVRVGGGTAIARGLRHARGLVTVPSRTIVVLISDFEEGGPTGPLLAEVRALADSGCHVLGCASLDDRGLPRYSAGVAGQLVAAGMPVAALSPLELARWVGERVGGSR
jgi:uncharacterized protein with von Willebrand factor type A (vWA) domain